MLISPPAVPPPYHLLLVMRMSAWLRFYCTWLFVILITWHNDNKNVTFLLLCVFGRHCSFPVNSNSPRVSLVQCFSLPLPVEQGWSKRPSEGLIYHFCFRVWFTTKYYIVTNLYLLAPLLSYSFNDSFKNWPFASLPSKLRPTCVPSINLCCNSINLIYLISKGCLLNFLTVPVCGDEMKCICVAGLFDILLTQKVISSQLS